MFRPIPPRDLLSLWFRTGFAMFEAQSLITLRLMRLSGAWPLPPASHSRKAAAKPQTTPTARRASGTVKRLTRHGSGQPA